MGFHKFNMTGLSTPFKFTFENMRILLHLIDTFDVEYDDGFYFCLLYTNKPNSARDEGSLNMLNMLYKQNNNIDDSDLCDPVKFEIIYNKLTRQLKRDIKWLPDTFNIIGHEFQLFISITENINVIDADCFRYARERFAVNDGIPVAEFSKLVEEKTTILIEAGIPKDKIYLNNYLVEGSCGEI